MAKTWHRYALPLALPVFAVLSVVTSRFAPEIIRAIGGDAYAGVVVPKPSWQEAYGQWAKNLSQMAVFIAIFAGASATSSLITSGQAQLLAVRPVSRAAQPLAALLARTVVLGIALVLGTVTMGALTSAVYPGAHAGPLVSASLAWSVCAFVMLALAVAFSAITGSTLAAVGVTIGVYFLFSLLALVDSVARYSPAGLMSLPTSLASGDGWQAIPPLTGVLFAAACLAWAARSFARREL